MPSIDGVILIDKPTGPTSFDVVAGIRRTLAQDGGFGFGRRRRGQPRLKCGHAGTLDPLATGLLLVLIGKGVRLSRFLMALPKRYEATVRFGVATDSLDRDGVVTAVSEVAARAEDLAAVVPRFCGEIQQIPPVYSALKHAGQRFYALARRGEAVPEPRPRQIRVHRLEVTATRWGDTPDGEERAAADGKIYEARIDLECSSGTYVRSLARDLAVAVGTVGHVCALRRLEIGPFSVAAAARCDELNEPTAVAAAMLSLDQALPHLPGLSLSAERTQRIGHGEQPAWDWLLEMTPSVTRLPGPAGPDERWFRMVAPSGELAAVGGFDATARTVRTVAVFPAAAGESRGEDS